MAPTVKINVGGVYFETPRSTLSASSYFRSYFERWNNGAEQETELFVDRSGVLFEHVLATLRNPDYRYPSDNQKEIENYRDELRYYGIEFAEEDQDPPSACSVCRIGLSECWDCDSIVCSGCSTQCTGCPRLICESCSNRAVRCDRCNELCCDHCWESCIGYERLLTLKEEEEAKRAGVERMRRMPRTKEISCPWNGKLCRKCDLRCVLCSREHYDEY